MTWWHGDIFNLSITALTEKTLSSNQPRIRTLREDTYTISYRLKSVKSSHFTTTSNSAYLISHMSQQAWQCTQLHTLIIRYTGADVSRLLICIKRLVHKRAGPLSLVPCLAWSHDKIPVLSVLPCQLLPPSTWSRLDIVGHTGHVKYGENVCMSDSASCVSK